MNFLAHLALAAPDEDLMVGGFLGDFIKGPIPDGLHAGVAQGVLLHRSIDAYSDTHTELSNLRQLLPRRWGRFSGIVLDLFIDHYLSLHWPNFHAMPLDEFIEFTRGALQRRRNLASESARAVMDRLYKYTWLSRYSDLDFTLEALRRIGARMRFENPLHQCAELVPDYYEQLCASAHLVYADSHTHVAEWRSANILTQ